MPEPTPAPKRPDRMPVLVLSGFLGAGKTTFLNALLGTEALTDSLVLVNEFGETGLDSLFIEEESTARGNGLLVEELTSGCLCCTLQGPLVQTLEDLLRARDNGRIAPFRQLIIETTGLADPTPILGAFARHPYLSLRYLVGGVVTVVDAAQEPTGLDANAEAVAQIAVADVLALSKTDLVDDATVEKLMSSLQMRNPTARRSTTKDLVAETNWLPDLLAQVAPIAWSETHEVHHDHHQHDHAHHHGHDHSHAHDHEHDHHHHHHAHAVVVEAEKPLDQRTITMFMDLLGMNFPGDLLRVKGIVYLRGEATDASSAEPWAVHAAGPLQHPPRPISDDAAARLPDSVSRLVVITRSDQTKRVQDLFDACLRQSAA